MIRKDIQLFIYILFSLVFFRWSAPTAVGGRPLSGLLSSSSMSPPSMLSCYSLLWIPPATSKEHTDGGCSYRSWENPWCPQRSCEESSPSIQQLLLPWRWSCTPLLLPLHKPQTQPLPLLPTRRRSVCWLCTGLKKGSSTTCTKCNRCICRKHQVTCSRTCWFAAGNELNTHTNTHTPSLNPSVSLKHTGIHHIFKAWMFMFQIC